MTKLGLIEMKIDDMEGWLRAHRKVLDLQANCIDSQFRMIKHLYKYIYTLGNPLPTDIKNDI